MDPGTLLLSAAAKSSSVFKKQNIDLQRQLGPVKILQGMYVLGATIKMKMDYIITSSHEILAFFLLITTGTREIILSDLVALKFFVVVERQGLDHIERRAIVVLTGTALPTFGWCGSPQKLSLLM